MANKPEGREFSLMGTLPLGTQTRGSWTYAYTRQGLKKFDTFSTDYFLSGPLKNSEFTWDNWRDVRDMYHGLDVMRKYPVYSQKHVPDFRIEPLTTRDQRPVINLGSIRVFSTVTEATSPAGGVTEHLAMGEGNVPVRFTLTPEARLELLCHLQSSAYLPSNPTCRAPLLSVVKETVMEPQFATCDRAHGWADAVKLGFQVLDSKRSGEGEQWNEADGFRLNMPDGTWSMDRMGEGPSPDNMDLSDRALENHLRGIDLKCNRGDATTDPRGEVPRLPHWLRHGGTPASCHFEPILSSQAVTSVPRTGVTNRDHAKGIPAYFGPEYGKYKDLPAHRQKQRRRQDGERLEKPEPLPSKRRIQIPLPLPPRKATVLPQATSEEVTIIGPLPESASARCEVPMVDLTIDTAQASVQQDLSPVVVDTTKVQSTIQGSQVSQTGPKPKPQPDHQDPSDMGSDPSPTMVANEDDEDASGTESHEDAEACLNVSKQPTMTALERRCALVNYFYTKPDGTPIDPTPLSALTKPIPGTGSKTQPDGQVPRRSTRIRLAVSKGKSA